MAAYLYDTTVLSIYLDPDHPQHVLKLPSLQALHPESPKYVSAVAIAELKFGAELAYRMGGGRLPVIDSIIDTAKSHAILDITHHTAFVYAEIKALIAHKFLAKSLRKDRPKYIEDWVDKTTGKKLAIDENDLWMCAQAKERDIIFVTADRRMKRISDADPEVQLLII